jgi:hypothetical protein
MGLTDQLKEGGRIIIPVGRFWNQELVLLQKRGGKLEQQAVLPVSFVPMTGEAEGNPKSEGREPKEGRPAATARQRGESPKSEKGSAR